VRIEGVNAFHWVFCCKSAVVHMADFTRGKTMDGHRPNVWASDRYSAQQRHGALHQTCLAHLAREVAYGLEASEDPVHQLIPPPRQLRDEGARVITIKI
jgi:transposase